MGTTTLVKRQRPVRIQVRPENIPSELKSRKNWVVARNKVPLQPNGEPASISDPSTWSDFATALAAYQKGVGETIWLALDGKPRADGLVLAAIDLDAIKSSKERENQARKMLMALNTFWEKSPSGAGLRGLCWARPLASGVNRDGAEFYTDKRFVSVTGAVIRGRTKVNDCAERFAHYAALAKGANKRTAPSDNGLNADLAANVDAFPPLEIAEIRAAALATPAESWRTRDQWWRLTSALASEAIKRPEIAEDLRDIMHLASSRVGAFEETFGGAYDRDANDMEWQKALRDTAKRLAEGGATITLGSLLKEAQDHGWLLIKPARDLAPIGKIDSGEFHISYEFFAPYRRRPIHDGLTFVGEVGLLVGMGGVAKSTYAMSAALAVASGKSLLGTKVVQAPVLILNLEDSRSEMLLRLRAAMAYFNLTPVDVPDLFVAGAGQADITLTESNPRTRREQVRAAGLETLDRLIEATGAQMVVLDPLSAAVPVGQNDNGAAAAVMLALKQIAERRACGFLIVAHTRKGAQPDVSGAEVTAGAGAWVNLSRIVKMVRVPDPAALAGAGAPFGAAHKVREVATLKSNLTPAAGPEFFLLESESAGNGTPTEPPDYVGVAVPFTPSIGRPVATMPPAALKDILTAIATGVGGAPLSNAFQARQRFAVPILAAAMGPHYPQAQNPAVLEGMARSVLADLADRGWVTSQSLPIAKKGRGVNLREGLLVDWGRTPFAADPPSGAFTC